MTKCGVTGIAVAVLTVSVAPALAQSGWVVRICRGASDASAVKITVGKPGGKDVQLVNWQSDAKETDFPVQDTLLGPTEQLRVIADSEPADGKVAMCVLANGTPVKAMNFTDKLDVTANQKGLADPACRCPKGQ